MNCLASFITCLVILFIIVGLPIIFHDALVQPKDPVFTLEHASITGFNLTSDDHLTSFFNVALKAENPNHRLKLKYTHVRVGIYKSRQQLAEDALHRFSQRKRNVTLLQSQAVALNVKLKKAPALDIRFESGLGYLDFIVFMTAKLGPLYNLEVSCEAKVNITAPPNFAASSAMSSEFNGTIQDSFPSVGCSTSVYMYSDNTDM